MLAAICMTILATSTLRCEVGPETKVQAIFDNIVPGEVVLIDPVNGYQRASRPFIVREDDPKWPVAFAASKSH